MDPTTGKSICQFLTFLLPVIGASALMLANWGVTHYQKRIDDDSKKARDQIDEQHDGTIRELLERTRSVESKLDPFVDLAKSRFPGLSEADALLKLRQELAEVRALATRDIPKPLSTSVRATIVEALRRWRNKNAAVRVQIDVSNFSVQNVQPFIANLMSLLREAGIPVSQGKLGITVAAFPTPLPLVMKSSAALQQANRDLYDALSNYIRSAREIRGGVGARNTPDGVIVLDFNFSGVPKFAEDGTVTLE